MRAISRFAIPTGSFEGSPLPESGVHVMQAKRRFQRGRHPLTTSRVRHPSDAGRNDFRDVHKRLREGRPRDAGRETLPERAASTQVMRFVSNLDISTSMQLRMIKEAPPECVTHGMRAVSNLDMCTNGFEEVVQECSIQGMRLSGTPSRRRPRDAPPFILKYGLKELFHKSGMSGAFQRAHPTKLARRQEHYLGDHSVVSDQASGSWVGTFCPPGMASLALHGAALLRDQKLSFVATRLGLDRVSSHSLSTTALSPTKSEGKRFRRGVRVGPWRRAHSRELGLDRLALNHRVVADQVRGLEVPPGGLESDHGVGRTHSPE
eukprot:6475202-Amphidinium_carterae.1